MPQTKVKVWLLSHTPQPEKTVASAARVCYSAVGGEQLMEKITDEKAQEFVQMLAEIGHESPIEHASFTFAVEGVSRSLLAQLTRHRIASYSVQSQRYVKTSDFNYVIPPEIERDEKALERYNRIMSDIAKGYDELSEILYNKHIGEICPEGKPTKSQRSKAEKMAIEDARFILPNACETKLIMTMNARSLQNFFRLRCCGRAQWEIRDLAWQMLALCKQAAPALFAHSGPACIKGACPEGKMSCGKVHEMRERAEQLG